MKVASTQNVHPYEHLISEVIAECMNQQSELKDVRTTSGGWPILEAATVKPDANPVFGNEHIAVSSDHATLTTSRNAESRRYVWSQAGPSCARVNQRLNDLDRVRILRCR